MLFYGMWIDVDARLAGVAGRHAGAFSMADVVESGGDRWLATRRIATGRWIGPSGGPWVLAGGADSLDRRRHLALLALGPGAVLSHQSAAELHRLDGIPRDLVVVTIPHHRAYEPPTTMTVHRIDDLAPAHLDIVDGFPTTTPARTIVDLAAVVSDGRLRRAVEQAVVDRRATFSDIDRVVREVRRRGKPGIGRLVRVLDPLAGEPPPASFLEHQLALVIRWAGVEAVRQYPLPWRREPVIGLADAAVPASRLLVEADGRRWHARLDAMSLDRRRDREAVLAGWTTLRWVYEDLVNDPATAASELRAAARIRAA